MLKVNYSTAKTIVRLRKGLRSDSSTDSHSKGKDDRLLMASTR